MCGIAGFIDSRSQLEAPEETLDCITKTLMHRGPNGQGIWFDRGSGVGLGHRRLSIIDLSPEGSQPMISASGRFVISYNGEVYNFGRIRSELEGKGHCFRGHSDTEIMLAAFEEWGLEDSLSRFIGMFAFALWDKKYRRLSLVRDRLGIKPLYYGFVNGLFVFASELKAIKACPHFDKSVDRQAITSLLRHMYVAAPYSIYEGIKKLPPGYILTLDTDVSSLSDIKMHCYWSAKNISERCKNRNYAGSHDDAIDELDSLLRDAVRLRMMADVPLGAFLSGGIDSSTVVALMQAQSTQAIKTFSIGFNEQNYNEAQHAKAVARHLGTEHTELYVTPEEAMAVIPSLPNLYDEPFADLSQIPTFLVSRLARQAVTVALSGDGGDELFYGYDRYPVAERLWQNFNRFPQGALALMGRTLAMASPEFWNQTEKIINRALPGKYQVSRSGEKTNKLAEIFIHGYMRNQSTLYQALVSHWKQPSDVVLEADEPETVLTEACSQGYHGDFQQHMMYMDAISYLPDDILVKVDRASMGVGLEARVPLLDHRVVEFAFGLPMELKSKNGHGKWILRQVLERYVPARLIDRPKMGFGVPIDSWLRGPLREWAEELLDAGKLKQQGFLDPVPIRRKWQEHLDNRRDWHYLLWDVLMFQAWLESQ